MIPAAAFACSPSACWGSPVYKALQKELNRVRPLYGLPSDVAVDGTIGSSTLAKLIKTAQAIDRRLGGERDAALDDYVYPDLSGVSYRQLSAEADAVLAALQRNGASIGPGSSPGAIADQVAQAVTRGVAQGAAVNPYGSSSIQNAAVQAITSGAVAAQAVPAGVLMPAAPSGRLPTWVWVGGTVLGLGVIATVVVGLSRRRA